MSRKYILGAAVVGLSGLLIAGGGPSSAQSVNDFVNGLRPIPQVLQSGRQGLPTVGAAVRPPRGTNTRTVSDEIPAAPRSWNSARGRHQAVGTSARATAMLPGCRPQADSTGRRQVTSPLPFEFGSAVLTPEAKQILHNLAEALNGKASDVKSVEIDGHTDAVGTYGYNEQLSQLRAEAAKDFLVQELGIATERLRVVGQSYCNPADPAHPDAAANRRVVFVAESS